jgi:spore germination cell wall hydrolase CwlJ-like protein
MKTFILALVMLMTASVASATERKNMEVLFPESEKQLWCLAQNIYYESRGSSLADQAAVADVVLNRVQDSRYPDSICEVVQQGRYHANGLPKRNQCQFSWWCDGKSDYPTNKEAWVFAQQTAYNILYYNEYRGITEGSTHYHADYVKPKWIRELHLVGRIGEHIFYRWR